MIFCSRNSGIPHIKSWKIVVGQHFQSKLMWVSLGKAPRSVKIWKFKNCLLKFMCPSNNCLGRSRIFKIVEVVSRDCNAETSCFVVR